MNSTKNYLLKKLEHEAKRTLSHFSSVVFVSFFKDEKILEIIRDIYKYDYPIYAKIPIGFDRAYYQKELYNMFNNSKMSSRVILMIENVKLWCIVDVVSFDAFSREIIDQCINMDFTIIDTTNRVIIDLSNGENEYEIRLLNYSSD